MVMVSVRLLVLCDDEAEVGIGDPCGRSLFCAREAGGSVRNEVNGPDHSSDVCHCRLDTCVCRRISDHEHLRSAAAVVPVDVHVGALTDFENPRIGGSRIAVDDDCDRYADPEDFAVARWWHVFFHDRPFQDERC